jgi:Adenylate and Guanylate cyclase catalytic domain
MTPRPTSVRTNRDSTFPPQFAICGIALSGPWSFPFRAVGITRSSRNPGLCSRCGAHIEEGHVVEITVIFADLCSFTEMTHDLGPERTHEVVDTFLRMASDILVKYGAFIDKYLGDAVMALFNVPLRHRDHPKHARADTPPPAEFVDVNPSRTMRLGAMVFAILGAQCAVAVLISPLAVALGFGTLFGLSSVLIYIDKSVIRIPVLILAALGAFANLYTLWHARSLRLRAVAEGNQQVGLMTALERRRTDSVLASAIAVLVIVVSEILLHRIRHPG